ncbi:MAG: magnesium/cobalt transporter CorA [Bacteroidales bacterium]
MVSIIFKEVDRVKILKNANQLQEVPLENVLWIDLVSPEPEEKSMVELMMQVRLRTMQEVAEIESSSRYYETDDCIIANSNFLIVHNEGEYINEPVSFIIKNNTLITYRHAELKSFLETFRKIEANHKISTGHGAFLMLFETRIDLDADLVESIAKDINLISKEITLEKNLDEAMILRITKFQEMTMVLRENIIDKQRVISGILKSEDFPKEHYEKIRVMIKDIGSLLDHTAFSFERLEYLQNTFLGLVNIEQNKIVKIFTVATVALMPPTLIASIYGMNFDFLPETKWKFGYPFAIILMVFSSISALYYFRRKKWL